MDDKASQQSGKPDSVSLIFIAAKPEQVWSALTDSETSPSYFFGNRIELGHEAGTPFVVRKPDGSIDVEGAVLSIDPPRRLLVTWRVVWLDELKNAPPTQVEYRIDDLGDVVRVTVNEYHSIEPPEKFAEAGRQGWALILSGLKTLLETGKPLPAIKMTPPQ
jgi:uncharacterized protein YndB with AHSA1/START domain